MTAFFTDCLVFKFEEFDVDRKEIDTTLYVLYDTREDRYLVRGQRKCTPLCRSCTYSYECANASDLVDFINYVVCPENTINEILYNYDNLPEDSNDITFEFLKEHDHSDNELSGYNRQKLSRPRLLRNLKLLRNVCNYY